MYNINLEVFPYSPLFLYCYNCFTILHLLSHPVDDDSDDEDDPCSSINVHGALTLDLSYIQIAWKVSSIAINV